MMLLGLAIGVALLLAGVVATLGAVAVSLMRHCELLQAQRDQALVELAAEQSRRLEAERTVGDAFGMVRRALRGRRRAQQQLREAGLLPAPAQVERARPVAADGARGSARDVPGWLQDTTVRTRRRELR